MQIREVYNNFLESGELFELLPNATGVWEKDKRAFQELKPRAQDVKQRLDLDILLDEEEDEDDFMLDY